MATPFILIDGYNLMHAAGLGRQTYGPGDLERCRNRLLTFLVKHLSSEELLRTTIVFDAAETFSVISQETNWAGLRILFAVQEDEADTLIEKMIAKHSAPRQLRVVSSDHRLQKAARRRRSRFVDSEIFVEELEKRGPVAWRPDYEEEKRTPKTGQKLSQAETEYWLEIFGEISETEEFDDFESEEEFWQRRIDDLFEDSDEEDIF